MVQWKVSFNPDPNKQAQLVFVCQAKIKFHIELYFNINIFQETLHQKRLGGICAPNYVLIKFDITFF